MVIWSGLSFLVAAITFLLLLIAEYVTESLFRDESYYQAHGWPKLLAFFLAGAVIWPLGVYLNRKQGKVMIEKETGKKSSSSRTTPSSSLGWGTGARSSLPLASSFYLCEVNISRSDI